MNEKTLNIILDEYDYNCSDGCCHHYGIVTTINDVELGCHNTDVETILTQALEHLGYKVNILKKINGEVY